MKVPGDSGLYEFLTHRVMSASSAGLIDWVCNTCPAKLASSDTSSNVKMGYDFQLPQTMHLVQSVSSLSANSGKQALQLF